VSVWPLFLFLSFRCVCWFWLDRAEGRSYGVRSIAVCIRGVVFALCAWLAVWALRWVGAVVGRLGAIAMFWRLVFEWLREWMIRGQRSGNLKVGRLWFGGSGRGRYWGARLLGGSE
jgi:hypothetical protein